MSPSLFATASAARLQGLAHRQRGVTLVELMVTIAINLVLVLAATLLYLNTRTAQKAVNERGAVFETGQFAMELLGREIGNAAFYPAISTEPVSLGGANKQNVRFTHDLAAADMGLALPYRHGLFGCQAQRFDPATGQCAAHVAGGAVDSDALVVSYFTSDAFSLTSGQRADCNRVDVIGDTVIGNNGARATYRTAQNAPPPAAGTKAPTPSEQRPDLGPLPDAPLLVVNRYGLVPSTFVTEAGNEVDTFSLACRGNGNPNGGFQELVRGVEQMVVRYGVLYDDTRTPRQYVRANDVGGLAAVTLSDAEGSVSGWQRVVSVRLCLLVRSPSGTAQRDQAVAATATTGATFKTAAVVDCEGNAVSRADGAQLHRFEQVFSVKNRQGNTVSLQALAAP
nr:PilW family protein [uncultured Aquabacterium sp.]